MEEKHCEIVDVLKITENYVKTELKIVVANAVGERSEGRTEKKMEVEVVASRLEIL